MKQLLTIVAFSLYSLLGFSQAITMDMGIGYLFTKMTLSGQNVIDKRNNDNTDLRTSISCGLTAKVFKTFYLRTEIGNSSFEDVLEMTYSNSFGTYNIFERYGREQWYFAILPEWRPLAKFPIYLNAGLGIYQTFNATGISLIGINTRTARGGFKINIGIAPKINDNLGILLNFGYNAINGVSDHIDSPIIGIKQFNFKLGFTYLLK